MGVAFAMEECMVCRKVFCFNPVRVPSFRVDGVKRPICKSCIEMVNATRVRAGREPFKIPDDAYDAVQEEELP